MAVDVAKLKYAVVGEDRASHVIEGVKRNFQRLDDQVQKSRVQMNQFGGSLVGTQRNMRKFALGGVQQAGYQIGDFAVQVANGTSKMQAFGQQAGQFFQIFGPFGAVLGAAISVVSAVFVGIERMEKATKAAAESFTDLQNSTKRAKDELALMNSELDTNVQLQTQKQILELTEKINKAEQEKADLIVESTRKQGMALTKELTDSIAIENKNKEIIKLVDKRLALEKDLADNLAALRELELEKQAIKLISEAEAGLAKYHELYKENAALRAAEANKQYAASMMQLKAEDMLLAKAAEANRQAAISMGLTEKFIQAQFTVNGRGSSQGGPSFDELVKNDPKVQLAYERMRLQDEEFKKAQEIAKKTKKMLKHELSPEMKRLISLSESIGQSFENAFMSAVDGTSSFKDAFKSMTRQIISELYRMYVVKRITGFIENAILGFGKIPLSGGAPGHIYEGGGYTGSGARAGGLDGKGGFMAMLHPNETVIDHTKGQGAGVTVVQNINISTGVQQTVRTEIKSMMPQIAESAKAAVADAKRRGGSYGRAFA